MHGGAAPVATPTGWVAATSKLSGSGSCGSEARRSLPVLCLALVRLGFSLTRVTSAGREGMGAVRWRVLQVVGQGRSLLLTGRGAHHGDDPLEGSEGEDRCTSSSAL